MVPPKYKCLREIWLKRPGSKCCVAIIRVELDGTVALNPKGFAYGPIPALRDLTPAYADELWATEDGTSIVDGVRTYRLVAYGIGRVAEIDVVFEKNKMQKYRITSSEIDSSDWYQVK